MNESEEQDLEFEPSNEDGETLDIEGAEAKLKKLKDELKIAKKERQEYLDGWQKERADFANYKKDESKRLNFFADREKEKLLMDFLPVSDSFNMAFTNKEAWEKVDKNWRSGVEYIYSQILSVLENNNINQFGEVGDIFNPTIHQSIDIVETKNEDEDHTIARIDSKGFIMGERVLRPAKVVVYQKN